MSLYDLVLHPTDLSPSAGAAQPLAFELARRGARLRLLCVDGPLDGRPEAKSLRALKRYAGSAVGEVETSVVRDVSPAQGILRAATEQAVDLIVMGTHGSRGLSRLLLGSTAREVVQLAPCAVLTVRHGVEGRMTPPLTDLAILAAVDFSEASIAALAEAARLARVLQARLDVVLVVEPPPVYARYPTYGAHDAPRPPFVERMQQDVQALRDEVASEGTSPGGAVVTWGKPAREIARVAEETGASLLVVGTHGRRGAERLLLGSVAETLVRTAPCPVLTIKDADALDAARAFAAHRATEHGGPQGGARGDTAFTWPPAAP